MSRCLGDWNEHKQILRTTRMEWHRGHKLIETLETAHDWNRAYLFLFRWSIVDGWLVGWLVFFFPALGVRMTIDARCSMLVNVENVWISFSSFVFWLFEGPVTAYGGTHNRSARRESICSLQVQGISHHSKPREIISLSKPSFAIHNNNKDPTRDWWDGCASFEILP